jgi:hypothetical protein
MAVCWLSERTCSLLRWSFQKTDLRVNGAGPPGPHGPPPDPFFANEINLIWVRTGPPGPVLSGHGEAGQGAGCGPGGPPHNCKSLLVPEGGQRVGFDRAPSRHARR